MKLFLQNLAQNDDWVHKLFYVAQYCGAESILYNAYTGEMTIDGHEGDLDLMAFDLEHPERTKLSEFFRDSLNRHLLLKDEGPVNPQIVPGNLDSKTLKSDFVEVKLKPHYLRLREPDSFSCIIGYALDFEAKSILYTEGKSVGLTIILPKKYEDEFFEELACDCFVPEPPVCLAGSYKD